MIAYLQAEFYDQCTTNEEEAVVLRVAFVVGFVSVDMTALVNSVIK